MRVAGLELEGSSYILLIAGIFVSFVMGLILFATKSAMLVKFIGTVLPFASTRFWQVRFVQGKPPSYQIDYFNQLREGKDFFLRPLPWSKKPYPLKVPLTQNHV